VRSAEDACVQCVLWRAQGKLAGRAPLGYLGAEHNAGGGGEHRGADGRRVGQGREFAAGDPQDRTTGPAAQPSGVISGQSLEDVVRERMVTLD
jgi:hypothetical protein